MAKNSDGNGENCTSSAVYEYDSNGNMTMEKYQCDGNGENCNYFEKYENGNQVASIRNCDSSERCSYCNGSKCNDYRHTGGEEQVERQRWVSTGGGSGSGYSSGSGYDSSAGYWETYTETITNTYYKP